MGGINHPPNGRFIGFTHFDAFDIIFDIAQRPAKASCVSKDSSPPKNTVNWLIIFVDGICPSVITIWLFNIAMEDGP